MSRRTATSVNPFIQLIQDGRITSLENLKRSYRMIVMRTHPDAVGSAERTDEFLTFSCYYEEAKAFLFRSATDVRNDIQVPKVNPRLQFYQKVKKIESLDMPYAFHRNEHIAEIRPLRTDAAGLFKAWNPNRMDLYTAAEEQHQQIWVEKPRGPYLKHALALNVRPILHNITAFHLTGRQVYRTQAKQNIKAIMSRLEEEGYNAFKEYLMLLIQDMENGPALFD